MHSNHTVASRAWLIHGVECVPKEPARRNNILLIGSDWRRRQRRISDGARQQRGAQWPAPQAGTYGR